MDSSQIGLVLVMVGCVGALFFIWMKYGAPTSESKKKEASPESKMPEFFMKPWEDKAPEATSAGTVTPISSDQHTIYAFERSVPVHVCPQCDGENSPDRSICCICGFEFRKGVRYH